MSALLIIRVITLTTLLHAERRKVYSSQVLPRVLYSTLPREDELADFQELNLARGNVSKQGGSWLVSEHFEIIEKV